MLSSPIIVNNQNTFKKPHDYVLNNEDKNIYTQIRCEIVNVIDIDDKKGLFHIQFYIKTYTKVDEKLISNLENYDNLWYPQLEFQNIVEMKDLSKKIKLNIDSYFIEYSIKGIGTFCNKLNLEEFPCDEHILTIKLKNWHPYATSNGNSKEQLISNIDSNELKNNRIIWSELYDKNNNSISYINKNNFALYYIWYLYSQLYIKFTLDSGNYSKNSSRFVTISFGIHISRKREYYFKLFVIPAYIIGLMSTGSMFGNIKNLDGRSQITSTMVLSLIALLFLISDITIPINNLNELQKFMLLIFFIISTVFIENIIAVNVNDDIMDILDLSYGIFIFILITIVLFIFIKKIYNFKKNNILNNWINNIS